MITITVYAPSSLFLFSNRSSSPSQLPNKFPQITPRSILEIFLQRAPIFVAIRPLHLHQQAPIPVQSHQSRDQELVAEFVFGVVVVVAVAASAS
jgi:hypothetical protein